MDYELMMNGNVRIGQKAPNFEAETTYFQIYLTKEYAISRGWEIPNDDFFIDDNVSGYTFDRPSFSKMIRKVQRRE